MPVDRTIEYLAECAHEVASWWDELHEDRQRGTPRRWAERREDPAPGMVRVAALAPTHDCGTPWAWAADSTPEFPRPFCPRCAGTASPRAAGAPWLRPVPNIRPGAAPAPARVDVLDTIPLIARTVLTLEDTVRAALGDGPADRAPSHITPDGLIFTTPALRAGVWPDKPNPLVPLAARYLARQAGRIAARDDLAERARDDLRFARARLRRAVGSAERIRVLAAPCPICQTLSLRAYPHREIIACTNVACRCQTDDCVCHRGGRHLWRHSPDPRRDEWAWLAQLLDEDLAAWLDDSSDAA